MVILRQERFLDSMLNVTELFDKYRREKMKNNDWYKEWEKEDWYREKAEEIRNPRELVMGEGLRRNAVAIPHRLALAYEDRRYTFKELNAKANQVANALLALGIKKGDKIGVFAFNGDYPVISALGVMKAGAVFVPINFRLMGEDVEYLLNASEAVGIFVDYPHLDIITSIRDKLQTVKLVIVMESEDKIPEKIHHVEDFLAQGDEKEPQVEIREGDLVAIGQTGGTTSLPKLVMWSHRFIHLTSISLALSGGYRRGDHCLEVLPWCTAAGLCYGWGACAVLGNTLYMGKLPPYDPVETLDIIQSEQIHYVCFAPPQLDVVLDTMEAVPNKWDVSSIHMINTIGASCLPGTRERTAKLFGENLLCPEYGSSETGLPTSLPPGEALKYPRSDGPAAWGQEVRIFDDDGKEMSQGEVGEICVASSMTTYGYYKNPEASRKAFVGRFVRSGDLGYLDDNGYIYVMGRKSDMILSGGANVYPEDVEAAMIKNPKIAEVAVIGVPDKKWGEAVKALVRLVPDQEATEEEIIAWCKENMPHYRAPKSVEFVTEFPYTPQGKIRKNVLREKYSKGVKP